MFALNDTSTHYEPIELGPNSSNGTPGLSHSTGSEKSGDLDKVISTLLSPSEAVLQELSQLSDKVYTQVIKFPRRLLCPEGDRSAPHVSATPEESQYFDRTLALTNSVIELYPKFIADVLHLPTKPYCSQDTDSGIPASIFTLQLDYPSILQINACHQRLADCWDDMLQLMGSCTEHMKDEAGEPSLDHIPVVQIGNYTPSKSQVVLMQATLLLQLLMQLQEKSSDLVTAVQKSLEEQKDSDKPTATNSMANLIESICLETQTRASANTNKISTLIRSWEGRGIVYGSKSELQSGTHQ